jgi:hypothetical protein
MSTLLDAARLAVYLSAAILAGSFTLIAVWSRAGSYPLGSVQFAGHLAAATLHAAAVANLVRGSGQPRLVAANLLASAVVLAVLPGGIFHVMFWPEAFLVGAAGVLCALTPSQRTI